MKGKQQKEVSIDLSVIGYNGISLDCLNPDFIYSRNGHKPQKSISGKGKPLQDIVSQVNFAEYSGRGNKDLYIT